MPERLVTGFYPVPALFHLFVDDHVHTHTGVFCRIAVELCLLSVAVTLFSNYTR